MSSSLHKQATEAADTVWTLSPTWVGWLYTFDTMTMVMYTNQKLLHLVCQQIQSCFDTGASLTQTDELPHTQTHTHTHTHTHMHTQREHEGYYTYSGSWSQTPQSGKIWRGLEFAGLANSKNLPNQILTNNKACCGPSSQVHTSVSTLVKILLYNTISRSCSSHPTYMWVVIAHSPIRTLKRQTRLQSEIYLEICTQGLLYHKETTILTRRIEKNKHKLGSTLHSAR